MRTLLLLVTLLITGALQAQEWSTYGTLPSNAQGRNHPITFAIGDTGYILTGFGAGNGTEMDDFYKYDFVTQTWVQGSSFPGGRRGFGYGVAWDGKGYAGFGLEGNSPKNDLWEYDPSTGQWTQLASCPCRPRWHPAMVVVDGKIFMGTGGSALGDLKDFYEYDIASDTWTQKIDFPASARHHPYHFGIGSDVYVGLGHSGQFIFNDFYKYDYSNNSWTRIADLPAQGRVAGTQFSWDGKGYVLSGQGENPFHSNLPTGEFWEYDPLLNQWDSLPPHPGNGRWAPGSWVHNDMLYMLCGRSNREEKDIFSYPLRTFTTGIDRKDAYSELKITPNPTNSFINLSGVEGQFQVNIYGLNGSLEMSTEINNSSLEERIDLSQLSKGIYFLELTDDTRVVARKKVIKL